MPQSASKVASLQLKIAKLAQKDMSDTLEWSQKQYGAQAALRYLELIKLALNDVLIKPNRLGVHTQEFLPSICFYHLRHSAKRLPREQRVKQPKHILVFRANSKRLYLLRLLHESMDIQTQLSTHLV